MEHSNQFFSLLLSARVSFHLICPRMRKHLHLSTLSSKSNMILLSFFCIVLVDLQFLKSESSPILLPPSQLVIIRWNPHRYPSLLSRCFFTELCWSQCNLIYQRSQVSFLFYFFTFLHFYIFTLFFILLKKQEIKKEEKTIVSSASLFSHFSQNKNRKKRRKEEKKKRKKGKEERKVI